MEFLRLTEKTHAKQPEYYITDSQGKDQIALYIGNIKQLNILIGANNTRKSRFIRQVINLKQKILLDSQVQLNEYLQQSDRLFNQIEGLEKEEFLIELHMNDLPYPYRPNVVYEVVKTILGLNAGYSLVVRPETFQRTISGIKSQLENAMEMEKIELIPDLFKAFKVILQFICHIYDNHVPPSHSLDAMMPISSSVEGIQYKFQYNKSPNEFNETKEAKLTFLHKILDWVTPLADLILDVYPNPDLVYIPTLRSSRALIGADKNLYLETLKAQYWFRQNSKLIIETGLDLYEKIERARNGHRSQRDNFEAFENFLSETFFQNRSLEIIPIKEDDEKRNIKISISGDNDDIPIHDLGDGVQSIIMLLLPIFTASEGSWIFIDEPENNLHPGFQNIFINAITENPNIKEKKLRFFINTHSNHILSEGLLSPLDTEVLVFSRRDQHSSLIRNFSGNEHHTLEMLGVVNTSVLISNCTVWVEGVTDRIYLRAFLKAYCQSEDCKDVLPIEDFEYSFIEYAGNNLVHYCFEKPIEQNSIKQQINAFFINSRIFLVADTDFDKENKHAYYQKIAEQRSNFHYHQTEVPEIENLLPNSIINNWLIEDLGADSHEVQQSLSQRDNTQKLGKLLSNNMSRNKKMKDNQRKFSTNNHGGTLTSYYKSKLADYLHQGVNSGNIHWEQLKESPQLEKLATKLYQFIKNNRSIIN